MTDAASQAVPGAAADGIAGVWWARRQDAAPRLAPLLDDTERQRWAAYRRDADCARFLVGCALAKTVVAACTGQPPGAGELRPDLRPVRQAARQARLSAAAARSFPFRTPATWWPSR